MLEFFNIFTLTPWNGSKTNKLTEIRLLFLKSIYKTYPIIEKEFFNDLYSNLTNYSHYSWFETIKRIIGPKNEDYKIENWRFIWAFDDQNRMYQILIQKSDSKQSISQGTLAALAPPELGKLFSDYREQAIHRTLSLLNDHSKIKFLIYLMSKGKSIAEEQKFLQINKNQLDNLKFINALKQAPNSNGQWFPSYEPRCPICNNLLTNMQDYRIGFAKLVCLNCGYEKIK